MRPVHAPVTAAAALLGLLASIFSTVVVSLAAARVGRDPGMVWMVMSSLVFGDAAWVTRADPTVIAIGMALHQLADIAWAMVFFVGLGRWTARLRPGQLLLVTPLWAVASSAAEWMVIVPLALDQPAFTLQQTYVCGFAAHFVAASMYPLFPAVRDALAGRGRSPHLRFAMLWGAAAAGGIAVLGVASALAQQGQEVPHLGGRASWDRDFMRRMGAHHEQGLAIARLAQLNGSDPHLQGLARLMIAGQHSEIRAMERWWRSWFDDPPALVCSEAEQAAMPGMLSRAQMAALERLRGHAFDRAFVQAMSEHHRGAVAMADAALAHAGDPRLVLMAQSIRHGQRGEIMLMRRAEGPHAVRLALEAMRAPFGAHPADVPDGEPLLPHGGPEHSGS